MSAFGSLFLRKRAEGKRASTGEVAARRRRDHSGMNFVSSRKPWRTGIDRRIASSRSWSAALAIVPRSSSHVATGLDAVDVGESPTWRRICEAR